MILAFVAALPLVALAIYAAEERRRGALEEARQSALLLARAHAAKQADILNQTRHLLAGVAAASFPLGKDLVARNCSLVLKRIVELHPFQLNASLASANGDILCSVRPLGGAVNVADREFFRRAITHRTYTVSEMLTGRITGAQLILAAYPVMSAQGEVQSMLIASLDAVMLARPLRDASPKKGAVLILVDFSGRIVARFPDVPALRGKTLPLLKVGNEIVNAPSEGFLEHVGADGVARVGAFSKLPNASEWPLYVVAGLPRDEIEEAFLGPLFRELLTILLVLAFALVISFIGTKRLLIAPLRKLGDAAQRYDQGDLSARSDLDHSAGEIGALARTFDTLATHQHRLTRALRALSAGNRTLLREKDEAALLQAMCRVAVEKAGYRLAIVNLLQHDEKKSVRSVAQAGHDEGFVNSLDLTWADTERGRGSVGTAIRTGQTCVMRGLAGDERFRPWREAALAHGFGSIASFPLRVDEEVIGTFSIIAAEDSAFDQDELDLLEEMAADLAFGIQVLRSNAKREAAEEVARRAITHDRLTGLPGRIPFLRAVETALRSMGSGSFAVVVAHLQNLQELNDSLGYDPANSAVMESAAKLKFGMSPATMLARTANDEFALLIPKADATAVAELARRLSALFEAPISLGDVAADVRAGIGASLYPVHGNDPEILLRRAGIAAREAQHVATGFMLYRGASERENPNRLAIAVELRQAIGQRLLALHYQAKIDLKSRAVCGAEALVRWPHATKGMIPPMQFVPIAEQTGLIRQLTSSVIEMAIRQVGQWHGRAEIPVAVNLSPRNLHDPNLLEQIQYVLGAWNVPARLIEFEITESALAQEPDKARIVLERLRGLGCKLYIDDFGTGYSSLSYLVSLPVQALKIDRSFVRQMSRGREARAVVSSIIRMAQELRLQTVAEGVETLEDADLLEELGCDQAQGYFFARPVPADEFKFDSPIQP